MRRLSTICHDIMNFVKKINIYREKKFNTIWMPKIEQNKLKNCFMQ